MTLIDLPPAQEARIAHVAWESLSERDARRLRELGVDEGVAVALLHRAPLGGDPVACRIGRMTIALRRACAVAIEVTT